jgi:cell division protein FtsB
VRESGPSDVRVGAERHPSRGAPRGVTGRGRAPGGQRPTGAGRRRDRGPRLTRTRTRSVVAATGGFLGVSSTRRAAVLALVVCALALTVAVPLRNYVAQRQELAEVTEQQRVLAQEVDALTKERARLAEPAEVAAQARSLLGYVTPGEVPYVVQLPSAFADPDADPAGGTPWYRRLWRDLAADAPR